MEDMQNIQWTRLISRIDARWVVTGVVVLIVALNIYHEQNQLKNTSNLNDEARVEVLAQKEVTRLINKLARFVILPENDEPVLAIVSDASKVADQAPFFRVAQNGDELLIYPKSGQVILYRPVVEKIVGMTTISTQATANQADSTISHQE